MTFVIRRASRRTLRICGLLAALSLAATGCSRGDGDEVFTLVAHFKNASPLITGNDVEVNGVPVGKIAAMRVDRGEAVLTLELERAALPIHRDAKATVRPATLLGERVVDLRRGTPSAPVLREGDALPAEQTGRSTDLDEVLNTIDKPTGEGLSALVTMLGQGLEGNGKNADAVIRALAPTMNDTNKVVGILRQQNQLLGNMVDNVTPVAKSLSADHGRRLDRLVGSAHELLGTAATNHRAFEATVQELPGTLEQTRAALNALTGASRAVEPTLREMRPTTDNLSTISGELRRFADAADPALVNARPVLERAERLLDRAKPVTASLKGMGTNLRGTAKGAAPLSNYFTKHLPGFWNFVQGWALATNATDGVSHYYRGLVTINTDQIAHLVPGANGLLNGDPGGKNSDPDKPGVLEPGDNSPRPQGSRDSPMPRLPGGLSLFGGGLSTQDSGGSGRSGPGLLSPGSAPDGGATGLTQQQEEGALQFLLGG